ncbi:MAG: hypothetical protein R6U84_08260 [Candidatus Cloacimonadales bacterium]
MKKILLLSSLLLLFLGCASEAEIKVINRTNHNIYFAANGPVQVLSAAESSNPTQSIFIDTGKKTIFSNPSTTVEFYLEGDTFLMQMSDDYGNMTGDFFNTTTLELQPDEVRKVYCDATHAGVKVQNNFEQTIQTLKYGANNLDSLQTAFSDLAVGDYAFQQLRYYSPGDTIYYSFQLNFADGSVQNYGGPGTLLQKDQLFYIDAETATTD